MSAPGLDLQVMELMDLKKNISRTSVNFMGCYAAIHALKLANALCISDKNAKVVIVCTELCTLHFQKENSMDNIASSLLFGEDIATLDADEVLAVFEDVPSTELPQQDFAGDGAGMVDLVARVQLASSKSDARRLVQSGGVYVNNRRIADVQARVTRDQAIGGRVLILRRGTKQQHVVKIIG